MRILVAESADFSPAAARILESAADVTWADADSRSLPKLLPGHSLLWVRLRSRIDQATFAAAPELRAVATPTTGLTHIDLEAARERGIAILSLRGETEFLRTVRATAELTIGLMLALLRKLPSAMQHATSEPWRRDRFRGQELFGTTVGLVGLGRLGQLVARYLHAFEATVVACDPYVDPAAVPSYVRLCGLDELLAESDLVSLHVNLTAETVGLLGAPQIAAMRPGGLLVNTARGELVEEAALLAALQNGHLAGAALDVLADEHSLTLDHPLLEYARLSGHLLITPHIGGCTASSMERTEVFLAGKVSRWIDEQRGGQ
jgi:phosphoglycerate dehydrogenase-like enzyme